MLAVLGSSLPASAAEGAEQLAYEAAVRDFDLGQWERAYQSLGTFESQFPESTLKAEVTQRRLFARAETEFAQNEFPAAAASFAEYVRQYPADLRSGIAAIRQAQCLLKLGDAAGAVGVLDAPDGPFARQLAAGTSPEVLFGGLRVKVDALRALKNWEAAIAVLSQAEPLAQAPADKAARLLVLSGVQEEAGQLEAAAQSAEAWLEALGENSAVDRRAEAAALAGRLWTRAGKPAAAEAAYSRNLAPGIPLERQREAVLELTDSALARKDLAAARERLQAFLAAQPADPANALLRLRLGQTLFQQFQASGGPTNATPEALALLSLAAGQFGAGLSNSPPPEVAGPLHLGRGWALWQEASANNAAERFREAGTNFAAATALLPRGLDQATARFKLADVYLRLNQPAAALTNYLAVTRDYADLPAVQQDLLQPALVQIAQSAVGSTNLDAATQAVEQLLARKPPAGDVAPVVLFVGQALAKASRPEPARAVLDQFLATYPQSEPAAEVELAVAAVELRARRWGPAVLALDRWVGTHPQHPLLPQAEFDRAWAAAQAGSMTNAVDQFAALAVRFPTNLIAQTALLWLADHHFSLGEYSRAGQACVTVLTNAAWRGTEGWHQARLLAAESARRRQSFASAREQLVELLNDRATPLNLVPSAYFALGETQLEQPAAPDAPPLSQYVQALEAFTAAAQFTNSPVSVAALGKMADCHLQLATRSTNSYAKADELYRRILESPQADLASRCKASVGLGLVTEKVAAPLPAAEAAPLLTAALNYYLDVVNGALLRLGDAADPWWLKEAGREAGRLLENRGRWAEAAALYERMAREFPAQRTAWELRASEVRKRASG